jgi:hypothetical protein
VVSSNTGRKSWGRIKQGDRHMGVSTRPLYQNRQLRSLSRCALAVVFFASATLHAVAAAPVFDEQAAETTNSIANDKAHEVSITTVEPGKESLALSARLTTMSLHVARDVAWQVRNDAGELILDATANELESPLPPGEYVVEAQYGAVSLRETVRLIPGNSVTVNFVLNAGGLRVLPTVKGLDSADIKPKTMVYALAGIDQGKLVAHSEQSGELLKLPAGQYRVETRMGEGNATAVTDVRIRPGKMSAIEVSHQAGLAHLSFVGAPDATVTWDIRPIDGIKIASLSGITQKLALKPGTYLAEAHVNGEILTAKFKIEAGEQRDIMLGN